MVTMTWSTSDPETAASLARTVAELIRGGHVRWEGLPGWQTNFHVTCRKTPRGPEVGLLLWPQPDSL